MTTNPKNITPESSARKAAAGRLGGLAKKGKRSLKVLTRARIERAQKDFITEKALVLTRAAMIPAMGQTFVYKIVEEENERGKTIRKHVLVQDENEIASALDAIEEGGEDPNGVYYYVTAKEPDYKAIDMLFNRAFGKPKETISHEVTAFSLTALAKSRRELDALPEPTIAPSRIIEGP